MLARHPGQVVRDLPVAVDHWVQKQLANAAHAGDAKVGDALHARLAQSADPGAIQNILATVVDVGFGVQDHEACTELVIYVRADRIHIADSSEVYRAEV